MTTHEPTVGGQLSTAGKPLDPLAVKLSREIITLLSDQLYQSPLKAIEELVVNSFDADAPSCRVVVPAVAPGTELGRIPVIAVYDDGVGMDYDGLADLWLIGRSSKRTETIERVRGRRQIGKFGIGKLATYALANRITYVSSVGAGEILALSLQFTDFKSDPTGQDDRPVLMDVYAVKAENLLMLPWLSETLRAAGLDAANALNPAESWTLVLLEELKEKVQKVSPNRLRWVLRTAMPLASDFELFLNGEQVISSKEDYEIVVRFDVSDLPPERLSNMTKKTGVRWALEERPSPWRLLSQLPKVPALVSDLFPEGIFGTVIVTKKTLYSGKSADLTRSHGFFVRVRGRLIDEEDPLSGADPRSYETFNRFRAEVDADDLDGQLTAPREGVGVGESRVALSHVLTELFNEARSRYEEWQRQQQKPDEKRNEKDRNYVNKRDVERPVADAILASSDGGGNEAGHEADESWFFLNIPEDADTASVAASLYETQREPYTYTFEGLGRDERLVRFLPIERKFILNDDHPLVLNYKGDTHAHDLLLDVATAEALLEVYLREVGLAPHAIGEVLERRDVLLKSLAQEQLNSFAAIAANLRGSIASSHDLEIALVVAARALGFVATHVSGPDQPDGLARLRDYPLGERKITLEAKSSGKVPSLAAIDFAGLARHAEDHEAQGVLLIAPDYPGSSRADQSAAARTAQTLKISCWTVHQLARVVESIDNRDITTRQVLDIVLSAFTPEEVTVAVNRLLSEPQIAPRELALALLQALRKLDGMGLTDKLRSVDMLHVVVAGAGLEVKDQDVRDALRVLVAASQGALTAMSGDRVQLNTSVEELERRVAPWLGNPASARRASTFRAQPLVPGGE
ncbi:ATP-binding protein [Micromonospora sp. NPDC005194]|uniref:ATP-binding protein n=1 Tax=Micromonospora sp. NPDC005194 TaxID=3156870 RepID=UPI00339DF88E